MCTWQHQNSVRNIVCLSVCLYYIMYTCMHVQYCACIAVTITWVELFNHQLLTELSKQTHFSDDGCVRLSKSLLWYLHTCTRTEYKSSQLKCTPCEACPDGCYAGACEEKPWLSREGVGSLHCQIYQSFQVYWYAELRRSMSSVRRLVVEGVMMNTVSCSRMGQCWKI